MVHDTCLSGAASPRLHSYWDRLRVAVYPILAIVGLIIGSMQPDDLGLDPIGRRIMVEGKELIISGVDLQIDEEFKDLRICTWREDGWIKEEITAPYAKVTEGRLHLVKPLIKQFNGPIVVNVMEGESAILDEDGLVITQGYMFVGEYYGEEQLAVQPASCK